MDAVKRYFRSPAAVIGLILLLLTVGMAFVGFVDDFTKITKQRSLGLTPRGRMILKKANVAVAAHEKRVAQIGRAHV